TPTFSASFRVSALNSGEWIIRFFLLVMVHLISDCTHLTQCPKLLVRISIPDPTMKEDVGYWLESKVSEIYAVS
ncbi:hypothetical protein AB4408_24355, partial [Vibrio sp. 10N.261.46.B6]|uniref:hypothetical protein n=1 Tax=Vibrio sp. 10N.261.46.B6 TaxID=3229659 RepID=UPI003551F24A